MFEPEPEPEPELEPGFESSSQSCEYVPKVSLRLTSVPLIETVQFGASEVRFATTAWHDSKPQMAVIWASTKFPDPLGKTIPGAVLQSSR